MFIITIDYHIYIMNYRKIFNETKWIILIHFKLKLITGFPLCYWKYSMFTLDF